MKNFTLLFAALFALILTSCQKEAADDFLISKGDDFTTQQADQTLVYKTAPKEDISQYIQDDADFSLFYKALVHTDLVSILKQNNITVFAPNNDVIKKLLEKGKYNTIQDINPSFLKPIMMSHISITGTHTLDSSVRGKEIQTLHENQLAYMKTTDGTVTLGSSITNILIANQPQTNGIIHQVSSLLMP